MMESNHLSPTARAAVRLSDSLMTHVPHFITEAHKFHYRIRTATAFVACSAPVIKRRMLPYPTASSAARTSAITLFVAVAQGLYRVGVMSG